MQRPRRFTTEGTEREKKAENISQRGSHVSPLRGSVVLANTVPPLPLLFVQGKRGGLRSFVPDGTDSSCAALFASSRHELTVSYMFYSLMGRIWRATFLGVRGGVWFGCGLRGLGR